MEKILTTEDLLHNNGVLAQRAINESRSLSYTERNILEANLKTAIKEGFSQTFINALVMEGERDKDQVYKPTKVVAVFACWYDGFEEIPPHASYIVRESNHPEFPVGGNTDAEALTKCGIKLPKTPSFEQWVKDGRKVVRS